VSARPFAIRPYEAASDADALARMADEVTEDGEAFVFEDPREVLAYWLDERGACFVAVDPDGAGGDVVGTYVVKPNQPGRGSHVANAGYLVARAARGRGLGRLMGAHSLETARALGYAAMQFNFVVATNGAAVKLWEELGFRIVGTLPRVFRHRTEGLVDAYVFYREL
jgi:ribosomal protein S18 acetylase RimI-like enzyme